MRSIVERIAKRPKLKHVALVCNLYKAAAEVIFESNLRRQDYEVYLPRLACFGSSYVTVPDQLIRVQVPLESVLSVLSA